MSALQAECAAAEDLTLERVRSKVSGGAKSKVLNRHPTCSALRD